MADGTATSKMLSVLRIITALLFMQHGLQKLIGFPAPQPMPFNPGSIFGVAALIETIGGFLMLIGLLTRPVAFVLSGEMAVAYFMVHAKGGFFPLVNKGELAVLYCFVFLYMVFAGPGAWSVDALIRKRA